MNHNLSATDRASYAPHKNRFISSGFTLVEILIVIVIIVILAAILFPVFSQAREQARKASCASNLKQIGVGWLLYAQDYDERVLPVRIGVGYYTSLTNPLYYWWGKWDGATLRPEEGLLFPYMKNAQIQACPSFDNQLRTNLGLTGYGYNYVYLCPFTPAGDDIKTTIKLGQIQSPTSTVLFADAARINTYAYSKPTLEGNTYLDPPPSNNPGFHARHNETGNILWADGHVKAARPIYRTGTFGFGNNAEDFRRENLGDIGNLTNEFYDLN